MLRRRARILHIDADWLELCPTSLACVGCSGQCGLLGRAAAPARWRARYRVPRPPDCRLKRGDEVELLLPARRFALAVVAGLGLPITTLLGGAALAGLAVPGPADLATVAGSLAGLAFGLWLAACLQPLRGTEFRVLPPVPARDA